MFCVCVFCVVFSWLFLCVCVGVVYTQQEREHINKSSPGGGGKGGAPPAYPESSQSSCGLSRSSSEPKSGAQRPSKPQRCDGVSSHGPALRLGCASLPDSDSGLEGADLPAGRRAQGAGRRAQGAGHSRTTTHHLASGRVCCESALKGAGELLSTRGLAGAGAFGELPARGAVGVTGLATINQWRFGGGHWELLLLVNC
jgi:hypothetical protein